jgi:hypothetical protein
LNSSFIFCKSFSVDNSTAAPMPEKSARHECC